MTHIQPMDELQRCINQLAGFYRGIEDPEEYRGMMQAGIRRLIDVDREHGNLQDALNEIEKEDHV